MLLDLDNNVFGFITFLATINDVLVATTHVMSVRRASKTGWSRSATTCAASCAISPDRAVSVPDCLSIL